MFPKIQSMLLLFSLLLASGCTTVEPKKLSYDDAVLSRWETSDTLLVVLFDGGTTVSYADYILLRAAEDALDKGYLFFKANRYEQLGSSTNVEVPSGDVGRFRGNSPAGSFAGTYRSFGTRTITVNSTGPTLVEFKMYKEAPTAESGFTASDFGWHDATATYNALAPKHIGYRFIARP